MATGGWASHWFVYASTFSIHLATQASGPLVSLYLSELGAQPGAVGIWLGVAGAVPIALSVPLGRLADRISWSWQILGGVAVAALGFIGLSQANSPLMVAGYLAVVRLGSVASTLSYQSMVASAASARDRVQGFGWLTASTSAAQSLGPAAAGLVADSFGLAKVFLLCAGAVATAVIGLPWIRDRKPRAVAATVWDDQPPIEPWWRNQALLFATGYALLYQLALSVRTSYWPLYLEGIGYTTSAIGFLFTVQAAASLVLRSQIGRLTERFGPRAMVAIAFILTGVTVTSAPWIVLYPPMLLLSVGFGLALGIAAPVTMSVAAGAVPRDRQGMALGLRYTAQRLGNTAGPVLLGLVAGVGGVTSAFLAASALSLLGVVGTVAGRARTVRLQG